MTTTATATQTSVGLVGNLTGDPELRFSAAGKPWCSFKIAVKPFIPGAAEPSEPVYYSVVCFGSLAENVSENVTKGSRVVVSGRLEEETWTGRDGVERTSLKVVADGVGPDLRFAKPAQRIVPKSSKVADDLLGPAKATTYSEPF
jgi:single-strand DNA-binding protein